MDKIKEKSKVAGTVREKAKNTPKELVRRGMEDGTERLRSQLRDTSQNGQQDEYGGDRIEDTAAGSLRRMERRAEKLIKGREQEQTAAHASEATEYGNTGTAPVIRTKEAEPVGNTEFQTQPRQHRQASGHSIKTKDSYVQGQAATQVTELPPEYTQGKQTFIRERGRLSAERAAERRGMEWNQRWPVQATERQVIQNAPQADRLGRTRQSKPVAPSADKPPKGTLAVKKPQIKEVSHSSKPAERTAGRAIKTVGDLNQAPASTVQTASHAAAQSAKTMQAAQQAFRYQETVKAAGSAAEKAVHAAGKALRSILAAARSLMAALMAGGTVTLSLLILICLFGMLVVSPFGILFTSEPTEEGTVALSTAIAQVNMEYAAKLDELQAGDYDEIIVDGAPPDWREVVAVFAVRTAGADDGVDVVTLDGDRIGRLKAVFWDMTELSSEVESIEHSDSDPNDGVDDSWTETILTITITAKAVDDMRTQYAFTAQQNNTLDELLENLGLLGGLIENLSVTEADAKALLAALPEDLSAERREVLKAACSLVGKVNYFWGGKSLVLGWDSRWGTTMKVTAEGSSTTGTYRPYGLDCSGFVDWVFYNATDGSYVIGHGGGAATQHAYCTDISWNEAIPGDLVFYDDDEHIGIVGGWDENGDLLIIHCASGYNNVVITGLEGFTSIGRPNYYTECRTAPQPGRGSAYLKRKERL